MIKHIIHTTHFGYLIDIKITFFNCLLIIRRTLNFNTYYFCFILIYLTFCIFYGMIINSLKLIGLKIISIVFIILYFVEYSQVEE